MVIDYSRFDSIDTDSEEEEDARDVGARRRAAAAPAAAPGPAPRVAPRAAAHGGGGGGGAPSAAPYAAPVWAAPPLDGAAPARVKGVVVDGTDFTDEDVDVDLVAGEGAVRPPIPALAGLELRCCATDRPAVDACGNWALPFLLSDPRFGLASPEHMLGRQPRSARVKWVFVRQDLTPLDAAELRKMFEWIEGPLMRLYGTHLVPNISPAAYSQYVEQGVVADPLPGSSLPTEENGGAAIVAFLHESQDRVDTSEKIADILEPSPPTQQKPPPPPPSAGVSRLGLALALSGWEPTVLKELNDASKRVSTALQDAGGDPEAYRRCMAVIERDIVGTARDALDRAGRMIPTSGAKLGPGVRCLERVESDPWVQGRPGRAHSGRPGPTPHLRAARRQRTAHTRQTRGWGLWRPVPRRRCLAAALRAGGLGLSGAGLRVHGGCSMARCDLSVPV